MSELAGGGKRGWRRSKKKRARLTLWECRRLKQPTISANAGIRGRILEFERAAGSIELKENETARLRHPSEFPR